MICTLWCTICHFVTRYALRRAGEFISYRSRDLSRLYRNRTQVRLYRICRKANISPKRIPYGICDMSVGTICHFVTRYALRRAGEFISYRSRDLSRLYRNRTQVRLYRICRKANISPKRIPYGICDMSVGTICHFVTRYALRRAGEFISYRSRDLSRLYRNRTQVRLYRICRKANISPT